MFIILFPVQIKTIIMELIRKEYRGPLDWTESSISAIIDLFMFYVSKSHWNSSLNKSQIVGRMLWHRSSKRFYSDESLESYKSVVEKFNIKHQSIFHFSIDLLSILRTFEFQKWIIESINHLCFKRSNDLQGGKLNCLVLFFSCDVTINELQNCLSKLFDYLSVQSNTIFLLISSLLLIEVIFRFDSSRKIFDAFHCLVFLLSLCNGDLSSRSSSLTGLSSWRPSTTVSIANNSSQFSCLPSNLNNWMRTILLFRARFRYSCKKRGWIHLETDKRNCLKQKRTD